MSDRGKRAVKKHEKASSHRGFTWCLYAFLTPILVFIIGYYISNVTNTQNHHFEEVAYSIRNAPRTRLSSSSRISYRDLANDRVPIVLIDSIVNRWKARQTFTTKFFSTKIQQVPVYSQDSKRSFITFHDNKPLEELVNGDRWEDYNSQINVTIPQLLIWDGYHSNTAWRYYSQEITQLLSMFPDILDYIQPFKPLVLDEDSLQVNLWIGRQGIITHTHYDATFNFFVQLQGRKRFTLFPPNQTMYLYPCLHPHYGHSQLDILNPDLNTYPLFQGAKAVVAEIGPGDMLIVPPFWFHHVETLEESVSVNIWSDAPEYHLTNEIYNLPIPFKDTWDVMELAMATCIYTKLIIESVGIEESYNYFIQEYLINQRYYPLISTGKLLTNQSCGENLFNKFVLLDSHEKLQLYTPIFESGVVSLKDQFSKILDLSIRRICVGNYIEHLIYRTVGLDCLYGHLLVCSNWK